MPHPKKNKDILLTYSIDDWDIDLTSAVKLENIFPNADLQKDRYYLFENGGWHPFCQVSKHRTDLPKIYREAVWPWVASLTEKQIAQISPYLDDSGYFKIKLYKNELASERSGAKYATWANNMHVVVAKSCVKNDDPKNKNIVDHIDENKTNYLVTNLQWTTPQENSIGGKKLDMDIKFDKMKKMSWFCDPQETIGMKKVYVTRKKKQQLDLFDEVE